MLRNLSANCVKMATCLGWTDLEGCGECIIPLSDQYYLSSLCPNSILFICKELLIAIDERTNDEDAILMTKCYVTCSGYLYIYKSGKVLGTIQMSVEYSKLVYICTLCYWAAYSSGRLRRKDLVNVAMSIMTINRMHDLYELWHEIDKIYEVLDVPILYTNGNDINNDGINDDDTEIYYDCL